MSDISFDEDLGGLLQEDQAPAVEPDHAEIVRQVQANSKIRPAEKPKGIPEGANSGAMPHEKKDRTMCIDGRMVKESTVMAETVDPESMNYLLARQKVKLEPSTLEIAGRDRRYPELDSLEASIGKICPFCNEKLSQEDCSWREIGSIVTYGQAPDGQPLYWHWEHLALQALLAAKGHPEKASKDFNLDLSEMTAMKQYFRSIPWGRLGFTREGQ